MSFEEPDPFYCNICGGPATTRALLKHSTFSLSGDQDEEDFDEEHELFHDYCNCAAQGHASRGMHVDTCDFLKGYDSRLVSRWDIKWLEDLRMLAPRVPGAHLFSSDDSEDLDVLTPLGDSINTLDCSFQYPRGHDPMSTFALNKSKGFLLHDTCLDMLKKVHAETISSTRPFSLQDLLLFFKMHFDERDDEFFDWGHGKSFGAELRYEDFENWNPVEGSEWTVMDPKRPVDFGFAIQHAFAESDSKPERSLSFKFPPDLQESTRQDLLSSLPSELRLRILEMLPTASILNLFLASSAFRQLRENLSQTFWKSRLYFDVPWCADMVLKQVNSQKNKGGYVRFHRLLRDVIDTSRFGAYGPIGRGGKRTITKDSLALRNRRHVWLNCERILEDIEARQAIAREQAGPIWTGSRGLISRKVASVSHPSTHRPEITSDVYFASYQDRTSQLKGITAHMTHQGHIIGIELHLSHEHSSQPHSNRLLGNRGELTDKVTIVSSASVVAVMISFGSIQQNQDQSAMVALSLVVEDRPSEPTYTVGSWNDGDVVQILFADTGMEVIGLTGEFNAQAFGTLGIITANKTCTRFNRVQRSLIDLQTDTRWIGSHYPPLDWPVQRYSLSPRDGDPSCMNYDTVGLDPPVFDAPVYFLNLRRTRLETITAYGRPDAPTSKDCEFEGFRFTFKNGNTETVGQTPADMEVGAVGMDQNETIVDLRLHFSVMANMLHSPTKLCGVQFLTSFNRSLVLGRTERSFFKQRSSARNREDNEAVCGLQIGLTPSGVKCMGLVFWRS